MVLQRMTESTKANSLLVNFLNFGSRVAIVVGDGDLFLHPLSNIKHYEFGKYDIWQLPWEDGRRCL